MSNTIAPILLFTFKRLDTLKQTVSALQKNYLASESDLYIFSDAAKTEKDKAIVNDVRAYLGTIAGFKSVVIYESETNLGLANSIISGVSKIISQHHQVIVLEDDLLTTPNFLLFMNYCLEKYRDDPKAFSISGYSFNLGKKSDGGDDAYFLNRGWSWGWATWKEKWNDVDWKVSDYSDFKRDAKARKSFSKGGSDLNKMLDSQMTGQLDSWAIRWFYHQFRIGGLTIYPVLSKVYNDGFDVNATHTTGSNSRYLPLLDESHSQTFILPSLVQTDNYYQKQFQVKMGVWSRITSKLETFFQSIFN